MCGKAKELDINRIDENMTIKEAETDGIKWFQPYEKPLRLSGFYWFDQDKVYRRFPVKPTWPLPPGVESLANCTAGGQIQFQTDSTRITLKVELPGLSNMDHMPKTGNSGFDLYVGPVGKQTFYSVTRATWDALEFEYEIFKSPEKKLRNFTLSFPLYNGVKSVQIGLDADAEVLAPPAFALDRPVIIYGTSITQGGCASRPGSGYTNILSRSLNVEVINLGFSGNGRGEPEVAKDIAEIKNPALLVLDYEANCPEPAQLAKTLPDFIDILREAHPEAPIMVVSKIRFGKEASGIAGDAEEGRLKREECKKVQMNEVEKRRNAGDKHISFFDGSTLLGDNYWECTVDGVHPTDMGFFRMAKNLEPAIRKILF